MFLVYKAEFFFSVKLLINKIRRITTWARLLKSDGTGNEYMLEEIQKEVDLRWERLLKLAGEA